MDAIRHVIAGIGVISCIWHLAGCAEMAVSGAFAGAGEYYRYTTTNVAQKTLIGNVSQITEATEKALKNMDIRMHSMNPGDYETEVTASTAELDIAIILKPITSTTTKVTVDAVKDNVVKDKATAAEILSQIQVELDRSPLPDNAFPKVFIKNECQGPIEVIVYYLAGKNGPEFWQVQGWFNLAPSEMKYVADTHNRYIYFYGETRFENKLIWDGNISQWFEGKRYNFFKVDMGTTLVDFTQSFICK